MTDILIPVLTMTALGFLFSTGLVLAYRKLRVEEDPKIAEVNEALPQANCGACGFSGCRAFAEAVVRGDAEPNGCPVGGADVAADVAGILGVEAGEVIRKVARVHCRGTREAAKDSGAYLGIATCQAAHLVGGNKQCAYGCLGFGDCFRACLFDAMTMGEDGLPVVDEDKCTACGKCVEACPRNIMELHPIEEGILVFCRSEDRGPRARKVCKNACIACGICVRACPEAIILENNLAKIVHPENIPPESIAEIERCPTDAIGRLRKDDEG
ncbi:MAG: RnfABCDGE type electron transport complex subunit B [Candidatus Aminicenantales bacterium]